MAAPAKSRRSARLLSRSRVFPSPSRGRSTGSWRHPPVPSTYATGSLLWRTTKSEKEIQPDGSKNLWSLSASLSEDNRLLKAAASGIRLSHSTASKLVGHWPHWPDEEPPYPKLALVADMPITLYPVAPWGALPVSLGLKTTLLLPSDCSKAACMIMGAADMPTHRLF